MGSLPLIEVMLNVWSSERGRDRYCFVLTEERRHFLWENSPLFRASVEMFISAILSIFYCRVWNSLPLHITFCLQGGILSSTVIRLRCFVNISLTFLSPVTDRQLILRLQPDLLLPLEFWERILGTTLALPFLKCVLITIFISTIMGTITANIH